MVQLSLEGSMSHHSQGSHRTPSFPPTAKIFKSQVGSLGLHLAAHSQGSGGLDVPVCNGKAATRHIS